MKLQFVLLTTLLLLPAFPIAGQKKATNKHKTPHMATALSAAKSTNTYYDQNRGGYLFVEKNGQITFIPVAPLLPKYEKKNTTSLQLNRWLELDLYPQQHYPYYVGGGSRGGNYLPPIPIIKH